MKSMVCHARDLGTFFSSGDEEPLNDFKQVESMLRLMF